MLLVKTITPTALEIALPVQQELQKRIEEVQHPHGRQMERARYESELARRRHMVVDPEARLRGITRPTRSSARGL